MTTQKLVVTVLIAGALCFMTPRADAGGKPRTKTSQTQAKSGAAKQSTARQSQANAQRAARIKQLKGSGQSLFRRLRIERDRRQRMERRLARTRSAENAARRSFDQASTASPQGSEYRAARQALRTATVNRANAQNTFDDASGRFNQARVRHREANRALGLAVKGNWIGASQAQAGMNTPPRLRPRKITFNNRVQVRMIENRADLPAELKGQLKPRKQ